MSAASFISLAGLIAFSGYGGSVFLMGWTGGYVILALLLAPYLRKFGEFTVPDFIGSRYYSTTARVVAVICLILISFTYVAGQMRGVGIVFSMLECLSYAHAITTEHTQHGFFMKAYFPCRSAEEVKQTKQKMDEVNHA